MAAVGARCGVVADDDHRRVADRPDPFEQQALRLSGISERDHVANADPPGTHHQQPVSRLERWGHRGAGNLDPLRVPPPPGGGAGHQRCERQKAHRGSSRVLGRVRGTVIHDQGVSTMTVLSRLVGLADHLGQPTVAHAHCDLPCGVYDPAQARIEAESVKGCMEKFNGSDDSTFKTRAVIIKEERAELVKHHLWVLWTDYFKPPHLEAYPQLHELFWKATKAAGEAKKTNDVAVADDLLAQIAEIDRIFWETKK
jgi:nickel superoxide dismutase